MFGRVCIVCTLNTVNSEHQTLNAAQFRKQHTTIIDATNDSAYSVVAFDISFLIMRFET